MSRRLDPEAPDVTGVLFNKRVEYIKKRFGQDGVDRVFENLNGGRPKDKRLSPDSFTEHEWYPFSLLVEFTKSCALAMGGDQSAAVAKMERAIAQDIGILKFFIKWTQSPPDLAKKAGEYWHKFHKGGELEVVDFGDNTGTLRLHDYYKEPVFCNGLASYFRGLMEMSQKDVGVKHTACTSKGDKYCEYTITWKK